MACIVCGSDKVEGNDRCATHNREFRKAIQKATEPKKEVKPIKKVSEHQSVLIAQYSKDRREWIDGKRCAVFPDKMATDVHHKKGKVGYADDWAREQKIPLLLDQRFWLPVSRDGHVKIELNPDWAKEMGFSDYRL